MRARLWAFVKRHIVAEVPDDMAACQDCDAIQCRDNRYKTCPDRLQQAARLRAMQGPQAGARLKTQKMGLR